MTVSQQTDVTYETILQARENLRGVLYESPCPESVPLSELTGSSVYCKLDYLQRTGSFKERGARNALVRLLERVKAHGEILTGVVAASAGNHALGVSYHGRLLGIPVTVVMPVAAPLIKVETCRRLGATIVLAGDSYPEARAHALKMAQELGLYHVPGFDDVDIVTGQGTMGLEILEQVSNIDAIIVPVGGGGLIAGIAVAAKAIDPKIKIIGVEPTEAASFTAALSEGRPVPFALTPTIADGLAVAQIGDIPFAIAAPLVEKVVTVTEDEIALAILRLVELEKGVVEGAAASTLAALLSGKLPELKGKRVVLCLCGGNIDPSLLCRVIERGLVADGRLCRFTVTISDRPGGLAEFCRLIALTGASIREIVHERAFANVHVSSVEVNCVLETRNHAHVKDVFDHLTARGVKIMVHPNMEQQPV